MILFLNFAPIRFMGGAEKWMNETAKKVSKHEESILVSVDKSIADIYSSLVLGRKFDSRSNKKDIHEHLSLDFKALLPFTSKWRKAREVFINSRVVYVRYELLEFLILFYFLGISGLKKTIAGIHSPFIYSYPETFFEKLHNQVYGSKLSRKILSSVKKVHVLTKRDFVLFSKNYNIKNTVYVPNGVSSQNSSVITKQDNKLHILFVGELSRRKGIDRLINIVKGSPENYIFTIVGDGPLKKDIELLAKTYRNCIYKGHVTSTSMNSVYASNEVLLLPSRAESMPLSILEAMSHGLRILNSKETSLDLDKNVEYSSDNRKISDYIDSLSKLFLYKTKQRLNKKYIQKYFRNNFSSQIIDPKLQRNIFDLNI